LVAISVHRKCILSDGTVIMLKRLTRDDFSISGSYEYMHKWLREVNEYLLYEFHEASLDQDKAYFL